ncbi:hypothetical protein [Pontibacter sp. BAB1700]|uniref:hypothetical protein n=1 Tax=Pontibacter sp. BAB1700 TaxID=1144253 RepID=UPI00026BE952|nr:hypothetical protein [Pontibacter sp. BAB1700]EJF09299.1 hypothetical protein O71_15775 [Pontibacter sp. BAB1700]
MKKSINYSLLIFLFSFIAFACSKEDGDMGPSASIKGALVNGSEPNPVNVDGYDINCLRYEGDGLWSIVIDGTENDPQDISNFRLALLDCPDPEASIVPLGEGEGQHEISAYIIVGGDRTDLDPIYNNFNSADCNILGTTSNVKFETPDVGEDLSGAIGTLYFTLDPAITLSGAIIAIKAGRYCEKGEIETCSNYCEEEPPVNGKCSYSQGYWFASPVSVWSSVEVGNRTMTYDDARALFRQPRRTDADKAFFQAATIILSGLTADDLPTDDEDHGNVQKAYNCIVAYFANYPNSPYPVSGCDFSKLGKYAGTIGDWIDDNHCEDENSEK